MENQDQALKRLLKKLSALRATLKSEERNLLDGLIIGSADEAAAHRMNVGSRVTPRTTPAADEAAAHRMNIGSRVTTRTTPASMQIIIDPIKEEYRIAH